jgi:hypothetical protein
MSPLKIRKEKPSICGLQPDWLPILIGLVIRLISRRSLEL